MSWIVGRRQLWHRLIVPIDRIVQSSTTTRNSKTVGSTIISCRQLSTSKRKTPHSQRQQSTKKQQQAPTAKIIPKHRNVNSNQWKKARQECLEFLSQHQEMQRKRGLIAQKVKELMVQLLKSPTTPHNRQQNTEKSHLATQLLQVALKDLIVRNGQKQRHHNEMRAKLYQMTIEAWVGTGLSKEIMVNAEPLLWEILSNPLEFFGSSLANNVDHINTAFAAVVFAICKAERQPILSSQSQERLQPLIQRIQELWNDPDVQLVPDSVSMDAILYYHFKLKQPEQALRILQEEIFTPQNNNPFLKPTLHGLNTVISAFAKQGNVAKARELLELMLVESVQANSPMPSPNVVSFNSLLDAIAKQGDATAGSQAEQVLEWMEDLSIYPNTISYTTAISAWSKSRDPRAAEKADDILKHMVELAVSGTRDNVAPNEVTISSVIHAWAVSGRADAVERAVANLERIQAFYNLPRDKLITVYNSLINAFANSKHAHTTTDEILKLIAQMEQLGIQPDARTHNTIMSITMRNEPNGPHDALQYFLNLETRYFSGDTSIDINTYSYNVALAAIAKLRDREQAPGLALELLKRMMDNANSTSHSTTNNINNNMEPDTTTYNTVMKILAKSPLEDAALRTEELLKELEDSNSIQKKPSIYSYSTCLSAWAYSRSPDRFHRMRQLLHRMEAFYTTTQQNGTISISNKNSPFDKPNVVPFNTVFIGCCCSSLEERETALCCVLETVDHLRRMPKVKANEKTYPVLLRAIGLNTKPGERRDALLSKEFELCIEEGLVNEEVIQALKDASVQVISSKLPANCKDLSMRSIPKEWKQRTGRGR